MLENRRYKRFIIEDMDIQCRDLFATEVKLLNISFGGAAISLNKRLNIGCEYNLKIAYEDRITSVIGVVTWENLVGLIKNERGEMVPRYEAGIRFNDVLADKGNELIDLIDTHIVNKEPKVRLGGLRVKIEEPNRSTLFGYQEGYRVKMISLSGMLIETAQKLEDESRHQMDLQFSDDRGHIEFLGRVVNCSAIPDKVPKRYAVGIEFIDMNEESKSKLKEFIDLLQSI